MFFKMLEYILGYPLYLISFFCKRNVKKIVVGSHTPFNDNSKYFFLASSGYLVDYEVIWITRNSKVKEHILSIGGRCELSNSLYGIYHCLTAKYYVYSFHLPDINFWTSGGSIKFNLWHGIPLKDIAFCIKDGPSKKTYDSKNVISRIFRPYIFVRPDYLLTTSRAMSEYFSKAFRVSMDRCLEYGLPRCDILMKSKVDILEHVRQFETKKVEDIIYHISLFDKSYIYMPTWRECEDFLSEADFDLNVLNQKMCSLDSVFIFKFHPFTKISNYSLSEINNYSNLLIIDSDVDVYPILAFTTHLITDYSSIYYDYLLLENNNIILFPFDYEGYQINSRSLAFSYIENMPGDRVYSFCELLKYMDIKESSSQSNEEIRNKFFSNRNADSTFKLCEFISNLNLNEDL